MTDNKSIQRARIVKYFVESAVDIIDSEGFDGVTLRKVADKAGYNSATLYNYFENLDHLLLFASLRYLKQYIDDIKNYIYHAKNPVDVYIGVWYCFIDHAFNSPEVYSRIFFTELTNDMGHYISSYYYFFPLEVSTYPKEIRVMLKENDIITRSRILLEPAIEQGKLCSERSNKMNDYIVYTFEALLYDVSRKTLDSGRAKKLASLAVKDMLYYVGGYDEILNIETPYF